jgi:hypothetical protein
MMSELAVPAIPSTEPVPAIPSTEQEQTSIVLQPEEFIYDEEHKLGRANGNTYIRRPPIENVHDGQIMVRLKQRRFIIIDYGYVPKPGDYDIANTNPHISIPKGAGEKLCATKDCPRVGVPVLLYDSEPNEVMSLYVRGGLCFSCQRTMNEKRRTKRKKKEEDSSGGITVGEVRCVKGGRYKINNEVVQLEGDGIIINGAVAGTRSRGDGYQHPEIGEDLLQITSELSQDASALVKNSSGAVTKSSLAGANNLYQKALDSASKVTYLLTQWKASYDEQIASGALTAPGSSPPAPTPDKAVAAPGTNGGAYHWTPAMPPAPVATTATGMMPPGMMPPAMMNPAMTNPAMMNPGMMNPGMMNQVNPAMMNPGMMPPGMMNPAMMNPAMMNPAMMNPAMMNPAAGMAGVPTMAHMPHQPMVPMMNGNSNISQAPAEKDNKQQQYEV